VNGRDYAVNKYRSAMTLLEVMIALTIAGVLLSITVTGFSSWNRNERVKGMTRSVADAFSLARTEAIRTGNQFLVVFNNGTGGSPTTEIAIVDDGTVAAANCSIDANEVIHRVDLEPDVSWGTTPALAGNTQAPDDEGDSASTVKDGWSFTRPGVATAASYVLFRNDGLPRLFTPGNCAARPAQPATAVVPSI